MVNFEKDACDTCKGNCWHCFHCDDCLQWLDIAPYTPAQIVKREISVALCESRHDIPEAIDGAIFPETIETPMDFDILREIASNSLTPAIKCGVKRINLYVTGLTPALLVVCNFLRENNAEIVTYHYNKANGEYLPLPIV